MAVEAVVLDSYEAAAFLQPGMIAADLGANIGPFSVLASRLVGPRGRILAVEPVHSNYHSLCRALHLNALSNVTPLELALGHQVGTVRLSLSPDPSGHSAVLPHGERFLEVPMTTLDNLCVQEDVGRLDFVKIDVEGFEPEVLRGGRESIVRFRPVISAAAYHLPEHRELLPAMIHEMVPDYEIRVAAAAPGLEVHCLAVPRERASYRR
jgi:FkbM family methyltransferase